MSIDMNPGVSLFAKTYPTAWNDKNYHLHYKTIYNKVSPDLDILDTRDVFKLLNKIATHPYTLAKTPDDMGHNERQTFTWTLVFSNLEDKRLIELLYL